MQPMQMQPMQPAYGQPYGQPPMGQPVYYGWNDFHRIIPSWFFYKEDTGK
jgi:hypothetical protein